MPDAGEASLEAVGTVGAPGPGSGQQPGFRSMEDVQAAVGEHGGDVEAVVVALGGSAMRLAPLDDWAMFRESCGLDLSDAAMRCLCRAAGR